MTGCVGDPVFVGSESGGGGGGVGVGGGPGTSTNATAASGGGGSMTTGTDSVCGNWEVESGEACEDGNQFPGDGCSPDCQLEAFCGNNVVEPGEKCDGVECDAMCEPLPSSPCASGAEQMFGPIDFVAGMPIAPLGVCASEPARFVGWFDTGPIPMRVAVRYLGTSEQYKLGVGCQQTPLTVCDGTEVTAQLPAHTLLWLTGFTPNEGDMRTFHVFLTRFGSWFNASGEGLMDGGGLFTWSWSTANNGQWAVSADGFGEAVLVTPPIDLSGIDAAAVHFASELNPGVLSTGVVEYSIDGMTWMPAGAPPNGSHDHVELALPGAEGQPAVSVRFVLDATSAAQWSLQNLFIGPPVPSP